MILFTKLHTYTSQ